MKRFFVAMALLGFVLLQGCVSEKVSLHKGEIKVVIFDVGGVLARNILGPKIRDLARKYDKDAALLGELRNKYRPLVDSGQLNEAEFWRQVLKDVGVEATAEDCDFSPYIELIDGTLEIAQSLKERYRLAILSNDAPETARARRDKFGFDELFEEIVISGEVGVKKPDPRIYELTIKRLGVKPGECLFIDDKEKNLEPAREIGMRTILFKDAEQLHDGLKKIGVALP